LLLILLLLRLCDGLRANEMTADVVAVAPDQKQCKEQWWNRSSSPSTTTARAVAAAPETRLRMVLL
jgi:hypothetical protein